MTQTFGDFFRVATGLDARDDQARLARAGLPDGDSPGADRAGVILAWLWRRLNEESGLNREHQDATPRRLVYALPPRGLAEPLASEVRGWLARLALTDRVALHVIGAARDQSHGEWRENMHQPAVVIGTADVLVSKLLLRGYDTGLVLRPIDFALLTNGAHWIAGQARTCPQTSATLRQVAAFARKRGTAEPFRLTFISDPYPERTVLHASAPAIPATLRERREEGTRTIVALDTAETAQAVYRDLRGGPARCTLLHSRFRGADRARVFAEFEADPEDRILVTTRAAEASLGLPAAMVVRETSSGDPAGREVRLISESDFLGLFDTGEETDIAGYVQDEDDLDAELAWATWTPGEAGEPDPEVRAPRTEHRCRVPIGLIRRFAAGHAVWRFDGERYAKITDDGQRPVRPGQVLLVNAADGGYDQELGFDPESRGTVADSPHLLTPAEQEELAVPPEAPEEQRRWQSLNDHSERVRDQATALLEVLRPGISPDAARSIVVAGYAHDLGKTHPIWQDALCALAADEDRAMVEAGRPWAKSGGKGGRLEFAGGVSFRHELGSLLLIDGPFRELLAEAPDRNLARYGVLAHHGILRVRAGDPDPDRVIRGLAHGATTEIPPVLGRSATVLTVDLAQFGANGDGGAWTETVRDLLARYGPFTLAYLETLVRMADWRASAGAPLPAGAVAG